jgi:hypothetical protein
MAPNREIYARVALSTGRARAFAFFTYLLHPRLVQLDSEPENQNQTPYE